MPPTTRFGTVRRISGANKAHYTVQPHHRLEKVARLINRLAQGKKCTLLDVGCGPATLMRQLTPNIEYFGVDITIPESAPNLLEADLARKPDQIRRQSVRYRPRTGLFRVHRRPSVSEIRGNSADPEREGHVYRVVHQLRPSQQTHLLPLQQRTVTGQLPRESVPLLQDKSILPDLSQLES